jgi:membrane-bound serine protease (ClpP class)
MDAITVSMLIFAFGAALLLLEVFIPDFGVIGVTGILALIVSFVVACMQPGGWVIALIQIGVSILMILFLYWLAKKKKLYRRIILEENLNEYVQDFSHLAELVGMEGIVKIPLKPFGTADFGGKIIEVYSEDGYIDTSANVRVDSFTNGKLYVRRI